MDRDGVGESQKSMVHEEAKMVRDGLREKSEPWFNDLGLAYVVVSKKVNQRFAMALTRDMIERAARGGRGARGAHRGRSRRRAISPTPAH